MSECNIIFYEEIGSTNDEAKRFAAAGAPGGTVVAAKLQTGGRGRLGRSWHSREGGLYFSIIIRPDGPFALPQSFDPGIITLGAGIAVTAALKSAANIPAMLKWPNDVLVNGKKLCGILAEQNLRGSSVLYSVLGVGVNVNNDDFPPELADKATSLLLETGVTFDINAILNVILLGLDNFYKDAVKNGASSIIEKYKKMCLTLGNDVIVASSAANREIRGKAADIDANGGLVLIKEDGNKITVTSGEVTLQTT